MSTLTLVRHGQARPFEKDSDRLSDLGAQQARALGEYWVRHGVRFDQVVSGSLIRHRETVTHAGFADCAVDAGWNEYDAGAIIQWLAPKLADHDPAFAARRQEFDATGKGPDRNRYFQRMLETLMDAWLRGAIEDDRVESFAAYQTRVLAALRRVVEAEGSNRNVVVFTSGGPVGMCVAHVLRAPDQSFLDVNWRIRNCSLTEFTFSKSRISLDSLNILSHLDRELWTWR